MNVAIVGAAGKMGRFLTQAVCEHTALQLTAATEHPESTLLGADVGELAHVGALNVSIVGSLEQSSDFDVLIDFTRPEPCLKHLAYCVQHNKAMVIGTTGFSTAEKQQINDAGQSIPVVFAPNMSVGVNLLYKLLEMATEVMAEDADIEIIEAHHRHKVDAPSGTALGMGEAIAGTLNKPLNDIAVYTREGHTGEREAGSIGFATIRAADIVGEHTALFASEGERIELTHKASSRMTFAKGAVRAAAWLSDKDAGVYSMQDVLNLSSR